MTQMTAQVFFVTASAKMCSWFRPRRFSRSGGRPRRPRAAPVFRRGRPGGRRVPAEPPGARGAPDRRKLEPPQASRRGCARPGSRQASPRRKAGQAGRPGRGRAGGFARSGGRRRGRWQREAPRAFAATHRLVEVVRADGKLERRMVETGVTDRVNTEIKSGLKEGEKSRHRPQAQPTAEGAAGRTSSHPALDPSAAAASRRRGRQMVSDERHQFRSRKCCRARAAYRAQGCEQNLRHLGRRLRSKRCAASRCRSIPASSSRSWALQARANRP